MIKATRAYSILRKRKGTCFTASPFLIVINSKFQIYF
nr:MAG TPA_asm: hypothetical protein [Caudoviricetes sp.]